MHFNRKPIVVLPLFVLALVLLRQGIVVMTSTVTALERQVNVMQQQDIEPAALFYTDSRAALRAIRRVEESIRLQ